MPLPAPFNPYAFASASPSLFTLAAHSSINSMTLLNGFVASAIAGTINASESHTMVAKSAVGWTIDPWVSQARDVE